MILPPGYRKYFADRREIKAFDSLDSPESYPMLPKLGRLDRVCVRLGVFDSFQPYKTWAMIRKSDGYFVRRVVWDRVGDYRQDGINAPTLYGAEAQLPSVEAETLLARLESLSLPPFVPENGISLDGIDFSVAYKRSVSALLSWHNAPPKGWEELAVWHERTIALFATHLPAITSDVARG